jgi:hypothetical protein
MVPVRVRADDRRHPFAPKCLDQRVDMFGNGWPGIDYRHLTGADDVGLGTGEGEGGRIGREQAAHLRAHRLDDRGLSLGHWGHVAPGREKTKRGAKGSAPPGR